MKNKILDNKKQLRLKRKLRIRAKCSGNSSVPRVSIFRSNKYFYAQAIDDTKGITIANVNGKKLNLSNNKESVSKIGVEFAKILLANNINEIVFDRNGYLYHGVVAAFADSLRENGIAL